MRFLLPLQWRHGLKRRHISHWNAHFRRRRSKDGGIVYHSGDLGYFLPSGGIVFLHRKDTQIMIYGKRVEVMKVEARLYQCSGIGQAELSAAAVSACIRKCRPRTTFPGSVRT